MGAQSCGEGGIRTLDTVLPVYHISSVVLSAAQPPLLKATVVYGTAPQVPAENYDSRAWILAFPFESYRISSIPSFFMSRFDLPKDDSEVIQQVYASMPPLQQKTYRKDPEFTTVTPQEFALNIGYRVHTEWERGEGRQVSWD